MNNHAVNNLQTAIRNSSRQWAKRRPAKTDVSGSYDSWHMGTKSADSLSDFVRFVGI
ncbi:hypothetical protein QM999_03880 [Pectobacterium cacticida]|uniref:hypothetical protein n=1 Tax=Pectobacterium cacticida TaxID=69221 RepID=UPI002FEF4040